MSIVYALAVLSFMHQPLEPKVQTEGEGWAIHIYFNIPLTCGMDRKKARNLFI